MAALPSPTDPDALSVIYGLFHVNAPDVIRYVGQTSRGIKKRLGQHLSSSKGTPVADWIRKHGRDNISYVILESLDGPDGLDEAEIRWIKNLRTVAPGGLNLAPGGLSSRGRVVTAETRMRLSESHLGIRPTAATRERQSSARMGKPHVNPDLLASRNRERAQTPELLAKKMFAYLGLNTRNPERRASHCDQGHEFTYENTGFQKAGRYCIACHRDRADRRRSELRKLGLRQA